MSTVTITIATPAVVTDTAHGRLTGDMVAFTTTGALPTGLVYGTAYYVVVIDANNYSLAATRANALAGTPLIATSGTQSGVHTASNLSGVSPTPAVQNLAGWKVQVSNVPLAVPFALDGLVAGSLVFASGTGGFVIIPPTLITGSSLRTTTKYAGAFTCLVTNADGIPPEYQPYLFTDTIGTNGFSRNIEQQLDN